MGRLRAVHWRTGTWTSVCGWGAPWSYDQGAVTCKKCLKIGGLI